MVGAGVFGKTGGVADDLLHRLLVQREKLAEARGCPSSEVRHGCKGRSRGGGRWISPRPIYKLNPMDSPIKEGSSPLKLGGYDHPSQ